MRTTLIFATKVDRIHWMSSFACVETAINIGYSCRLLVDEMEEIYVIDGDAYEVVEEQLQHARTEMQKILRESQADPPSGVHFSNGRLSGGHRHVNKAEEFGGFALVVNGHSLVSGMISSLTVLLESHNSTMWAALFPFYPQNSIFSCLNDNMDQYSWGIWFGLYFNNHCSCNCWSGQKH